ncbi:hypothetical protein CL622_01600 [archaeon]|nr:hypothetical protein [archaeon]
MKTKLFGVALLLLLFLFLPLVSASEHGEPECSWFTIGDCVTQALHSFFLGLFNAPLLPLLSLIQSLLIAEPSIEPFGHVWAVVTYILSFFYIFLFIYAGYLFLFTHANPVQRFRAKTLLRNLLIMIVLIQGSFIVYELALSINSVLNQAILSLIDPEFFLFTFDNIALELVLSGIYLFTLIFTTLLLGFRYILISLGIVLFPIGLFLYTFPPLRDHGRFILNLLGCLIFVTFFDLLIILGCSLLIDAPIFVGFQVIVMIVCFFMINYTLWWTFKFAFTRSTTYSLKDDLKQTAKYIAMVAA